jgi:predicted 3-demethylubiquinone-9 3-methyltransferase (glyoxalase superfamily)
MSKIAPCLWFDGQAEEAAAFYMSVFPESALHAVSRYGEGAPFPAGTALMVEFTLAGQRFQALNGGPQYQFSQAISLSISCKTEAELDHYWRELPANGGEEVWCGWVKDRFGVSWQVIPEGLGAVMSDPDPARVARAMQAMMSMKKLDLAALRAAAEGNAT